MLIIAILAAIAIPAYVASIRAAREAVLREDLHVMRDAIDSYTNDKNKAPQTSGGPGDGWLSQEDSYRPGHPQ